MYLFFASPPAWFVQLRIFRYSYNFSIWIDVENGPYKNGCITLLISRNYICPATGRNIWIIYPWHRAVITIIYIYYIEIITPKI